MSHPVAQTIEHLRTFSNGKRCKNRPVSTCCGSRTRSLCSTPEVTSTISRLNANGRKLTIASRYTKAHNRPIASGLSNQSASVTVKLNDACLHFIWSFLRHVAALVAPLDEELARPSYQGVGECKANSTNGHGCIEWLAIAPPGVDQDC